MATSTVASGDAPAAGLGGGLMAKNASVLIIGQVLALVVPLLTVPYLARVLGPEAWGPVVAAQALGNWLLVILEFGFELSGTRSVAQARVAPETLGDVVHGVQSAKAVLAVATLTLSVVAFIALPAARTNAALLWLSVAFAVLRGFSPLWFFQGIERVRGAVAVDALSRTVASLGVFFVVHGPGDGWKVLALQAGFAVVSVVVLTLWLARHVVLRSPELATGLRTLREGQNVFACRAWSALYIQGNALILSGLAGPITVALFGGAERIIRAAINLLAPFTQVFLPRVTHLREVDPPSADALVRRALLWVGLLGLAMGVCGTLGAPILVHLLLGAQYEGAIPVLRLMGALPGLIALNTVLGLYWALPMGRDRLLLGSIVAAGLCNVVLALVLVPRWGATGMASATIAAEVVSLAVLTGYYVRRAPAV